MRWLQILLFAVLFTVGTLLREYGVQASALTLPPALSSVTVSSFGCGVVNGRKAYILARTDKFSPERFLVSHADSSEGLISTPYWAYAGKDSIEIIGADPCVQLGLEDPNLIFSPAETKNVSLINQPSPSSNINWGTFSFGVFIILIGGLGLLTILATFREDSEWVPFPLLVWWRCVNTLGILCLYSHSEKYEQYATRLAQHLVEIELSHSTDKRQESIEAHLTYFNVPTYMSERVVMRMIMDKKVTVPSNLDPMIVQ